MTDPTAPRRRVLCDEASLVDLEQRARRLALGQDGGPWPSGWRVVRVRPSRVVVRAVLASPSGPMACYAKFRRRSRPFDALKDRIRLPRGPAEGRVLVQLAAAGLDVPAVVAWSGDPTSAIDLLVTAEVAGVDLNAFLATAPSHDDRARAAAAVGRMLAAAHRAGLNDRDLHRGNVLVDGDRAIWLDTGTRPPQGPLSRRARERALGRALHGLSSSPKDALRALAAYVGATSADLRTLSSAADRQARRVARRYRAGRSRRATRTGRHFETLHRDGASMVRRVDGTSADVFATLATWTASPPPSRRSLKSDGHVFVAQGPGFAGDVVAKVFDARRRDRFRVPRAIRAFRRAYALRIRGVACPKPLAAYAAPDGTGVYVAELVRDGAEAAPSLDRIASGADALPFALSTLDHRTRADFLFALGRFLRGMHDADVLHRDLKSPNLVVSRDEGRVSFSIVDLEGARVSRRDVGWRRRARDLGRLDASMVAGTVTNADRFRVLDGYLAPYRRLDVAARTFAAKVRAASARKRPVAVKP